MSANTRFFIVNNIKLPINASSKEAFSVALKALSRAGIRAGESDCRIFRRSVDARRKNEICFVYSVAIRSDANPQKDKLSRLGITVVDNADFEIVIGTEQLTAPPVIVGTGPCGLFAALILAENGYNPILIERGGDTKERVRAIERFTKTRKLDLNTNIQFGAGGAGTFSDGKLLTRINDAYSSYVLRRFVEFGAPEEILYLAKPHIGTDILINVVDAILQRIESLGGKIIYHTTFEYPITSGSKAYAVKTSAGDIDAGALILALGHSARDTYENLMNEGFSFEAKSFSVGMRIEHLKADIDRAMYGDMAGNEKLGAAEYTLSHNTKERGVYTFCMCPGGEVVAAASESGGVVVNGMSRHSRNESNSNSAVCCSVFKEDYGSTPRRAIEFQREIERKAFIAGGSDYSAPIITVADFINDKCETLPSRIIPTYMEGVGVRLAKPDEYLPGFVTNGIRNALSAFDKKIAGFAVGDAILTGAETRTSAPVRILRSEETRAALGFENIYPAGEGAGYAGGITSAAIDGVRTALALIKKYKP